MRINGTEVHAAGRRGTARGAVRRGCLHALWVRWNRMGYPAGLFFGTLAAAAVVMIVPVVLLVAFADKLGAWWAILLILYMGILISVYTWIVYPREMARMRYLLGDEAFFLVYPGEKKKERKRREKELRRLAHGSRR